METSPTPSSSTIQLIDENQNLHLDEFAEQIKRVWKLHQLGTAYRLISVMGSQSSGKSTLLNSLFGTKFAVMDETARAQTTKGIWISNVAAAPNTLVMDVEGTDGRERGENQDFERKSALFSLALSEVLIVNLWEHSVGLYNGANMALLKTVFEVNLELFARKDAAKTCLFFVIRDFLGKTSAQSLASSIVRDLERLWNSLAKPKGFEDSMLADFFDVEFDVLPHKFLKEQEFEEGIERLGKRFFAADHATFLFRNDQYLKSVPADGLAIYVSSIWSQILQNKDLDLPTQQQLLSQFRCDEISKETFDAFKQEIALHEPYSTSANAFDGKFLEKALQLRAKYLQQFALEAHRYHAEVVREKQGELALQIDSCLCKVLSGLAKCALHEALAAFAKNFDAAKKDKKASFKQCIETASSKAKQEFASKMACVQSEQIEGATFEFVSEEFEERLAQQVNLVVERNARKILDASRVGCNAKLDSIVNSCIESFFVFSDGVSGANCDEDEGFEEPNGWSSLLEAISQCIEEQKEALETSLTSNLTSPSATQEIGQEFLATSWKHALRKCTLFFDTETISAKLDSMFEKDFKTDPASKMPRIWSTSDDIDSEYLRALTNGLAIVDGVSSFDAYAFESLFFESPNGSTSNSTASTEAIKDIMTSAKAKIISERFKRHADAVFVETKRALLTGKTHIPPWILVLLLVLGWREMLAVLKNPLYLFFFALVSVVGYLVFSLGLQRPAEAMVRQFVVSLAKGISSFASRDE